VSETFTKKKVITPRQNNSRIQKKRLVLLSAVSFPFSRKLMSISKLTGVQSECGPSNGLDEFRKQFSKDQTLHKVNDIIHIYCSKLKLF
jgi:hypothetical protein